MGVSHLKDVRQAARADHRATTVSPTPRPLLQGDNDTPETTLPVVGLILFSLKLDPKFVTCPKHQNAADVKPCDF